MRMSRLSGLLAGLLVAFLATGSVRLAHFVTAHTSDPGACDHACSGCPQESRGEHQDAPAAPGHPTPSECATCALLAVLMPDGLPVSTAPFYATPSVVAPAPISGACPSIDATGISLARGPPDHAPAS